MIKRIDTLKIISAVWLAACVPTQAIESARFACAASTSLPRGHLVFFGEVHGTVETPALVGEYVCSLASTGKKVTLGLEIPSEEQARLNKYLTSQGLPGDKSQLLNGQFWKREIQHQDGRSSAAMFELIDRVRQIKAKGGDIRLVAIDSSSRAESRDAAMAATIRSGMTASPGADFVVLTGNIHGSKSKGSLFDREFMPTAHFLLDASPITIFVTYRTGSAWVCMSGGCGGRQMTSLWANERDHGYLIGASPQAGYDGIYLLDAITASPPAGLQRNDG